MYRIGIAEAEHFAKGSTRIYGAIFGTAQEYSTMFLHGCFGVPSLQSMQMSKNLLGCVVYPRLTRVLFGIEQARKNGGR